jgi:hypothetical protein
MRYAATLALWVDALAVEPTGSGASISSGSAREEALGEKALGEKALREKALAMARRSWDWASCVARPASRPCCLRRCRPPPPSYALNSPTPPPSLSLSLFLCDEIGPTPLD